MQSIKRLTSWSRPMVLTARHISTPPNNSSKNSNCTPVFEVQQPLNYKRSDLHNLSKNNGGLLKAEFSQRRSTLATRLLSQETDLERRIGSKPVEVDKSRQEHMVIIPSAKKRYMVDKIPYIFRQATDFRYLTGSKSLNDSALIMSFDGAGEDVISTLVLPDISAKEERWEGQQLRYDEAADVFGVDQAIYMEDFEQFLASQLNSSDGKTTLWYDYLNPTHSEVHRSVMRFIEGSTKVRQPIQSPRQIIHQQRVIKSKQEIEVMRRTCQVGAEALTEAMLASRRSSASEAQVFATVDYCSRMRGADYLAYPPVVAAGANACIIHYTANSAETMNPGDLLLCDAGCEYGGYTSDITRTWPLSGQFDMAQKTVYEAVLDIQEQLIAILYADAATMTIDKLYKKMQRLLGEKLMDLGLVSREISPADLLAASSEFCPHHVSHYLGMDVHDTNLISRNIPLEEGMVLTVEPGIYIPRDGAKSKYLGEVPGEFLGVGVRIEDDILIVRDSETDKLSCEVLSRACPKKVQDIESLLL